MEINKVVMVVEVINLKITHIEKTTNKIKDNKIHKKEIPINNNIKVLLKIKNKTKSIPQEVFTKTKILITEESLSQILMTLLKIKS